MVDLISLGAELVLYDAGLGSIGWLAAVQPKQANPFASVHDFMPPWGGNGQLQPTKVAASAQMRGVLNDPSLEASFHSRFWLRHNPGLAAS